jgi:hypothetical protein
MAPGFWYCYYAGTKLLVLSGHGKMFGRFLILQFDSAIRTSPGLARMVPLIALLLAFPLPGQGCPHQGSDHRLLGRLGCPIQRKLTIEDARPPRTIWHFRVLRVSVKIDPRHPHVLIEWPARSQRVWRFRAGYRWDANARAYIFPALALKRVDGPMQEYQTQPRNHASGIRTNNESHGSE